ncbi:post-transcriptional regulator [Pseudoneobacillus rhizosphaerae]|uniref:Post-transcriptional regulator ComN n=1 Tax=Pseudoneobacillus rhizosphaerae TaxID=2880968 RepID=A0A9C7G8H2_9BACI|nr:post-transcriptional regulator [Pseudoneobacillus rhizosphaerae]CAG9607971.1 Post-transcriptional regulator ComN [Pseudoneobacillus rhizosphaerae]
MNSNHLYDQFRVQVEPAIRSKLEELSVFGYGIHSESQLWSFLTKKKWKKPKEEVYLFEIVQDILTLKPGEFMSFQTVEALKSSQFSLPNEEDWKELLK